MLRRIRSVVTRVSPVALLLTRVGLGCVFLSSSLPKLRQPFDFLGSVYDYQIVGPHLGFVVAAVLPWAELIVGIALIAGIFTRGALLLSAAMAAMFAFAAAVALRYGLAISCGCFSTSGGNMVSFMTLIRAIAILLASLGAYVAVLRGWPDPSPSAPKKLTRQIG